MLLKIYGPQIIPNRQHTLAAQGFILSMGAPGGARKDIQQRVTYFCSGGPSNKVGPESRFRRVPRPNRTPPSLRTN